MNNPNPFVPQGSLLEQQSRRRSHLKLAVFCVLAIGIASLSAMLIQGCKREEDQTDNNNQPPVDTNTVANPVDTNLPPVEASNPPVTPPPQQVVTPPPPPPAETEYVVVKGDTYSKIAKSYGVTTKALEDANPNIPATKLKVGEKLTIPPGASATGATAAGETANGVATINGNDEVYVVKTGDTLIRIAKHYGVTVKAVEAENNMSTTRINVGQKLKIPAKAEAAPVNAPPATVSPTPTTPPVSTTPGAAPANPQSNPPPAQTNPQ